MCVKVTSEAVLVIAHKALLLFMHLVPLSTEQSSDMDAFGLSVTVVTDRLSVPSISNHIHQ